MRLSAHGISADLPAGWEGAITRPAELAPQSFHRAAEAAGRTYPVAHLANFALPDRRDDFGGGLVEEMRDRDIFISLLEFGPECAGTALFSAPRPRVLNARSFSPRTLQRTIAGQAGHQTFFTDAGRAFCLYVVIGDRDAAPRLAGEANRALTGLRIDASR